ncbi:MAG: four helix bundle protein [Lishizhenia sp.]
MANIQKIEDIQIWKDARILCQQVWKYINYPEFKKSFALVNQIDRSSGSVMDNVAEGFERSGKREFIQFLSIAKGSCGETKSQLIRALDRSLISQLEFETSYKLCQNILKQLQSFIGYLKKQENKGYKFEEPIIEYKKLENSADIFANGKLQIANYDKKESEN